MAPPTELPCTLGLSLKTRGGVYIRECHAHNRLKTISGNDERMTVTLITFKTV